jgi:hypothetical protein
MMAPTVVARCTFSSVATAPGNRCSGSGPPRQRSMPLAPHSHSTELLPPSERLVRSEVSRGSSGRPFSIAWRKAVLSSSAPSTLSPPRSRCRDVISSSEPRPTSRGFRRLVQPSSGCRSRKKPPARKRECPTLHLEHLWDRNITITTRLVDTVSTPMLLDVLRSRKIDPTLLITHRFKLDGILDAYEAFGHAADTGALKVIIAA